MFNRPPPGDAGQSRRPRAIDWDSIASAGGGAGQVFNMGHRFEVYLPAAHAQVPPAAAAAGGWAGICGGDG